ncbi:MAG: cytochrome c nitrite reductase small subunit [Caldilineaceae bacterium]|nr:cytochrome c nitrite reductase small subunit [Caldilineaceae bacterium]
MSDPKQSSSRADPAAKIHYWSVGVVALLGILFGLGTYTFNYAQGLSYFSNDPQACVNCHVMRDQFESWNHSSHKSFAACNDCHTPHAFPDKWIVKGINGWNHSLAFTTGNFPDPIQIRDFNQRIALDNCTQCHEPLLTQIHQSDLGEPASCLNCHGNVGHGN